MTWNSDERLDAVWALETVTVDDRIGVAMAYTFSPLVPDLILLEGDFRHCLYVREHSLQALIAGVALILISLPVYLCLGVIWLIMLYWGWRAYRMKSVSIPLITPLLRDRGWV